MDTVQTGAAVVRKIILLALLGLAAVFLAGPVAGMVAVVFFTVSLVMAFAFVGLLIWGLFQLITVGPQAAWERVRHLGFGLGRILVQVGGWSGRVLASLPRMWTKIRDGAVRSARFAGRTVRASARFGGEISLMALTGAAIAVTLGAVAGEEDPAAGIGIPFYALFGAVLAGVVAIVLALRPKHRVARFPSPRPILVRKT